MHPDKNPALFSRKVFQPGDKTAEPEPERFLAPNTALHTSITVNDFDEDAFDASTLEHGEIMPVSKPVTITPTKELAVKIFLRKIASEIILAANHREIYLQEIDSKLGWTLGRTERVLQAFISDEPNVSTFTATELGEIAWALDVKIEFEIVSKE